MAKIIATTFGAAIALFGLAGFLLPNLFGALCSPLYNVLNLLAGAAVVYAAQRAGPSELFWLAAGVGSFYFLGGLAGIILGRPGSPGLEGMPPDGRLVVLIPKALELGHSDHTLNLFFGIALITCAVVSAAETPFRLRK